jgi:hypothetical protein
MKDSTSIQLQLRPPVSSSTNALPSSQPSSSRNRSAERITSPTTVKHVDFFSTQSPSQEQRVSAGGEPDADIHPQKKLTPSTQIGSPTSVATPTTPQSPSNLQRPSARDEPSADVHPQKNLPPSTPIGSPISVTAPTTPDEHTSLAERIAKGDAASGSVRTDLFNRKKDVDPPHATTWKPSSTASKRLAGSQQQNYYSTKVERQQAARQSELGAEDHKIRQMKQPSTSSMEAKPSTIVGTPRLKEEVQLLGKDPSRAAPDRPTVTEIERRRQARKQSQGNAGGKAGGRGNARQGAHKSKRNKRPVYLTGSFSPPLSRRETS